jgi:hypothetical protein
VSAISKRFDFLANGADLLFRGLRLHDYEHMALPRTNKSSVQGETEQTAGEGGLAQVQFVLKGHDFLF